MDKTNPTHYRKCPVNMCQPECIEFARHLDFDMGNAFKYIWRAGQKTGEGEAEDLRKAAWYLEDAFRNEGGDLGVGAGTLELWHVLVEDVAQPEDSVWRVRALEACLKGNAGRALEIVRVRLECLAVGECQELVYEPLEGE